MTLRVTYPCYTFKRTRFKTLQWLLMNILTLLVPCCSAGNNPPRFLSDGQTEIVVRLKEGSETPVGECSHKLRRTVYMIFSNNRMNSHLSNLQVV